MRPQKNVACTFKIFSAWFLPTEIIPLYGGLGLDNLIGIIIYL